MKPENVKFSDCGGEMISRKNSKTGERFWGCKMFPSCKGTRDVMGMSKEDKNLTNEELMEDDELTDEQIRQKWNRR